VSAAAEGGGERKKHAAGNQAKNAHGSGVVIGEKRKREKRVCLSCIEKGGKKEKKEISSIVMQEE